MPVLVQRGWLRHPVPWPKLDESYEIKGFSDLSSCEIPAVIVWGMGLWRDRV